MNYEMEELIPIVAELAEKYTGYESTSVTYEKAEQLMGAVLYCINELERADNGGSLSVGKLPARQAYDTGMEYVRRKVEKALCIYNETAKTFKDYGNVCLYDTFIKGIPEFFKWYDVKYEHRIQFLHWIIRFFLIQTDIQELTESMNTWNVSGWNRYFWGNFRKNR